MSVDNKIRIAHVMGKMNYGGVEAVVMNYFRNINKENVQFDFIVDEDSVLPQKEEILKLGGNIYEVPKYQKMPSYLKAVYKIFKQGNYTIVHAHMNTLSVFPLAMAKLAKVPIRIAHSHSTDGKGEIGRNIIKGILKFFSKLFATHYFACSAYSGEWLFGRKAMKQGKITVINNAIATEKFRFSSEIREEKRKELGIENSFVIGHIGRFMPQKNHTFLLEIFAEIYQKRKDAILLLVGDGKLEEETKQKAKQLGIEKACKFLGNRTDVYKLYQAMDVFILPSLYEGLPVVGIEAQTSGLKTILSSTTTKETRILESTVFLNLEDGKEKWAEAALKEENLKRQEAADIVKEKGYEIAVEANKLEKIYEEMVKKYA